MWCPQAGACPTTYVRGRILLAVSAFGILAGCFSGVEVPSYPGAVSDSEFEDARTTPLPLLALHLDDHGALAGSVRRFEALQYCHLERYLHRGADTDTLVFVESNVTVNGVPVRGWWHDLVGEDMRPEHFQPGQGAPAAWHGVRIAVVRLERAPHIDERLDADYVLEFLEGDFIAFVASSPMMCCFVDWEPPKERYPIQEFAADHLVDTCHDSRFDPYRLVPAELPPRRLPSLARPSR